MIFENVSSSALEKFDANKLMCFDDPTQSHLPSTNVLRVAKYETLKKTRLHHNPVIEITKARLPSRCI